MAARRTYGTGSIIEQADRTGRTVYYGKWRHNGHQVKRRLGFKRMHGKADGLTRAGAEAALRDAMAAQEAAEPVTPLRSDNLARTLTMADLARRYDADRGRRLKDRTRIEYDSYVRVHLAPFFGDKAIGRIRREDVADFVKHLERRGLSAKTIRNVVMFVSTIFNHAVRRGWLGLNPATSVDLPRPEDHEAEELHFLEPYQVFDLVAAVPDGLYEHIDRAMYLTAALAGMRRGELLALRWESVDFDQGRIRVVRAFSGPRVSSTKGRRQRSVPMAPQIAQALMALRDTTAWSAPSDLVFAEPATGERLAESARYTRWKKARNAAGISETFVWHWLRHSFGTTCARRGVPLATIAQWMGHQSTSTTEIYAMHAPAHQDGALLGSFFDAADPRIGTSGTNLPASSATESTSAHREAA